MHIHLIREQSVVAYDILHTPAMVLKGEEKRISQSM